MPSPNGLAYRPVMRFSVVPQWVPFEIERPDPSGDPNLPPVVATLRAWDKNLTHSAVIDIAVEAAIDVYREVIYAEQQRADEPGPTQIMPLEQAATAMHAEILCAVIEGLEMDEATVLAAGPWQEILSTLGWWQPAAEAPAAPSDDKQDADDPEGQGEPATTTGASSPDSVPSMALFDGES